MSWKLVRKYVFSHYNAPNFYLIWYLRTFPENTKCQSWMVLVNELKIGTQVCYNARNFSFLHENDSWEYKMAILEGFSKWAESWYTNMYFHITIHQILILYLKTFPESIKSKSWKILVNELKLGIELYFFAF